MQEDYAGDSDGTWMGIKYFSCEPNKGKFIMLNSLKPVQRTKTSLSSGEILLCYMIHVYKLVTIWYICYN